MKKNFLSPIVLFSAIMLAGCAEMPEDLSNYNFFQTNKTTNIHVSNNSVPKVNGIVTKWLDYPTGLVFLPNDDALVLESETKKLHRVSEHKPMTFLGEIVDSSGAEILSLKSLVLSPDFVEDNFIYFYATTNLDNRILRATYNGKQVSPAQAVFTGIPKGKKNNGGCLSFSSAGNLYIGTGDADIPGLAQDEQSFAGKILRTSTENISTENDLQDIVEIYSLGHKNVQSCSWSSTDSENQLWSAELNDSNNSAINQVNFGDNFGWGAAEDFSYVQPFWQTENSSLSSLINIGDVIYVTDLQQKRLWKIKIDEYAVADVEYFFDLEYGQIGLIAQAANNVLWMVTRNTDGTSKATGADDRVIRLTLEDSN